MFNIAENSESRDFRKSRSHVECKSTDIRKKQIACRNAKENKTDEQKK